MVGLVLVLILLGGVAYAASSTLSINAGDEVTLQPTGCTPQLAGTLLTCPAPTTAPPTTTTTQPQGQCMYAFVPAYYEWATVGPWDQLIAGHPSSVVVGITATGPGSSKDSDYAALIVRLKAAGIDVYGYVDTNYGARSTTSVRTDISRWKSFYAVGDIFFDQVSTASSKLAYYQGLNSYTHTLTSGSFVVLNPGVYPSEALMSAGDVVVTFESGYSAYAGASPPSWVYNYPSWRFVNIVLSAPSSALSSILATAQARNVANIYVTDLTEVSGNPFSGLPSYWSSEVAQTCP